jgi:hypothetical protein
MDGTHDILTIPNFTEPWKDEEPVIINDAESFERYYNKLRSQDLPQRKDAEPNFLSDYDLSDYNYQSVKMILNEIPTDFDKKRLPHRLNESFLAIAALNDPMLTDQCLDYIHDRFKLSYSEIKLYEESIAILTERFINQPIELEERDIALEFLKRPDLMEQTINDITELGIVDEEEVKGLIYLSYTSRKCPAPISFELRAPSGVGKSHIVRTIAKLMPQSDLMQMERMTRRFLDHIGTYDPVRKILIITEAEGSQDAEYSIRMLTDVGSPEIRLGFTRVNPKTKEMESVTRLVKGPLVFAQTSTRLSANPENESRLFIISLTDSEEHRGKVQRAIKQSYVPHRTLPPETRDAGYT